MSVYMAVPKEDVYDIEHHGIMGQKWGIRRYQNKDGSLTPEGKARYGNVENFNKVMRAIKTGTVVGGPIGGVIGGAIADKKYGTKGSKNTKNRSAKTGKKNVTDEEAIAAAKKAGLHQGDNYKVYRKAMSGDKEAQKIVEKWESQKKKPSIDKEVDKFLKIVSDKEAALKPGDDPSDAWDEAVKEYDKRKKTKK